MSAPRLRFVGRDGARMRFEDAAGGPCRAQIAVLGEDLVRVQLLPAGRAAMGRSWATVGSAGDAPAEGRDREDLSVFACPDFELREGDGEVEIRTERLRLTVREAPFALEWRLPSGAALFGDHPWRGYGAGDYGRLRHTLRRDPDEIYLGLGEASGPLDRHHRRYRLRPSDALGYDAELSDPLYKHLPFVIALTRAGHASALFYDTAAETIVDLGAEIDHYLGPYRYTEVDAPELDYYVVVGPELPTVVRRTNDLTGYPPLPPRWTLGYLGSTMHYTDADDPAAELAGFVAKLAEHAIPCSGFHLSSGYSLADDGRRYVFEWNRRRVPDPAAAVAVFADAGIATVANVKPALLESHPAWAELAAAGRFVRAAPGSAEPYRGDFWGGRASLLDFTDGGAYAWWRERLRERVLGVGIDASWNDNNEFQIAGREAHCRAGPARWLRPVLSLLMNRASRDAQREARPDARDWQLTRSGMAGSQRYAQTWSGDNRTSWKTLAYNLPMGLNLSLCGWAQHGHDVGGFAGPAPDAELFVRWVQHGILMPRFCIHSWNDDGVVTEPWMHPEATATVRELIRFRVALVPYLYTLARGASERGEPITRPLAYAFQGWAAGRRESFVHLLGPALLVAPVLEPGARERRVTLPPGRWLEPLTGRVHDGGEAGGGSAVLAAPLAMPPLLLREGHAVPLLHPVHRRAGAAAPAEALLRGAARWGPGGGVQWLAFPDAAGAVRGRLYWDDGTTRAFERGAWDAFELRPAAAAGGGVVAVASRLASGMGEPRMELLSPFAPGDDPALRGDPEVPAWRARWSLRELPLKEA